MNRKWIDPEIFHCIIKYTPLVSIDIIVENEEGKFLLGLRKKRPAKDFWFVPGGRVFKGEALSDAFKRISKDELGIELDIKDAEFLGVFEHFYEDNYFGTDTGTHYVVNAYKVKVKNIDIKPDSQHKEYKWFSKEEILKNDKVHQYCKVYFEKKNNLIVKSKF